MTQKLLSLSPTRSSHIGVPSWILPWWQARKTRGRVCIGMFDRATSTSISSTPRHGELVTCAWFAADQQLALHIVSLRRRYIPGAKNICPKFRHGELVTCAWLAADQQLALHIVSLRRRYIPGAKNICPKFNVRSARRVLRAVGSARAGRHMPKANLL